MSAAGKDPSPGTRLLRLRARTHAALEADVRAELESHIAMRVDYLMARGATREEAERDARARFGDYDDATRQILESARERDVRMDRMEFRSEVVQDLRLALRRIRRAPWFFAAIILTLAIGIGANGAVFSILRASLLQELPYRDPGRLVMAWRGTAIDPTVDEPERGVHVAPTVLAWRDGLSSSVGDIAAIVSGDGNLDAQFDVALGDRVARLKGAFVTPNFFRLLGVRAEQGRLFSESDVADGQPLVAISHQLWEREFGADASMVGRSITLTAGFPREARTFVVSGILPERFRFSYPVETQIWAMKPWSAIESANPREIRYQAIVRLNDGISLVQAQQRAATLRVGLEFPGQRPEDRSVVRLEPVTDWVVGQVKPALYLLAGVAALLLCITCATVANALLARASARSQELSVRIALGASRMRLVRQLLAEGALLAVMGAAAGTLLAVALQPVLRALIPASVPIVGEIAVSPAIVAFGAAMAALTILLAAVAPAWGGTHVNAPAHLTRSAGLASSDRHRTRWRQSLVAAQTAIATALLVSATLLLVSFWRLGQVPLGFDGEKVLTVEMRLLSEKYRPRAARLRFQEELLASVRAIPGVIDAGLTSAVPFRGVDFMYNVGVGTPGSQTGQMANSRFVDPAYFAVLGIQLLRGRLLTDADRAGAPRVAVISQGFAREAFGDGDPLGKVIMLDSTLQVVGVVADVRYAGFARAPGPAIYVSRAQHPSRLMCIVARTRMDAASIAPAIHRAVREVDPAVPAMRLTTIDRILDESVAERRFYTIATTMFASIALVLTVVGLLVVVGRVVAERRREMAIRAALGASGRRLVALASRDALAAVTGGVVVGLVGAYWASALLTRFLFEVSPRSPWPYAAVASLLIVVAGMAAWASARRLGRLPVARALAAE